MYLDRVEITGFKSFAEKTTLVFPKPKNHGFGITAIVGPNGSGKSNIIDATAWAMGEQSLKTLRSRSFENIIFASAKRKFRTAEVNLCFSNDEGEPIFTVSRRLLRSGENEYLINKDRVKLTDVLFLLAQNHFGQKSYALVNQGMTDAVLRSSQEERETFFNEATGVEQYILKRDQSFKKINKTQKNLDEALIALRELTPHLNSLKRQMNKLKKRKEIETELRNQEESFYSQLWFDLKKQMDEWQKKLEKKLIEKNEIEKVFRNFKSKIEAFSKEELNKTYLEKQKKYEELLNLKNDYLRNEAFLEAEIKELEKKAKKKGQVEIIRNVKEILEGLKEIKNLFLKIEEVKEISKINELIQRGKSKLEDLINCFRESKEEVNLDNLYQQVEEVKNKIISLNKELEKNSQELGKFLEEEKTKREKIVKEQKEIENFQNQFNLISSEVNEIKIELAKLETKKDDLEKEIIEELGGTNNLKEEIKITASFEEIKRIKRQLEIIGGIDKDVEKEYASLNERFNFLSTQTADLKKSVASLKEIVSRLDLNIKKQFQKNFAKINEEFSNFFKILFNGGEAKVKFTLLNPRLARYSPEANNLVGLKEKELAEGEPEEEEIGQKFNFEIIAQPPGKKIRNIEMLSGGEKTLTSLSLICAIIAINKPPFVILDEADAALDEKNSDNFARIIKELSSKTQLILITHNPVIMEIVEVLYGASMDKEGVTKLVSLKLE